MSATGPIDSPTNPGGSYNWGKLTVLIPVASTLATIGSNPVQWLRGHVFGLIAEWFVAKIIGITQFVLGWMIFAFERTASIILDAAGPLSSPARILGDAIVGAIETLYGAAHGVAQAAGLAGPPAAAFAVATVVALLAVVSFALFRVLPGSDAIKGGLEALR